MSLFYLYSNKISINRMRTSWIAC